MKTTIEIDDRLMAEAQRLINIENKSILIDTALRLYVTIENQKKLMELWGEIDMEESL